MVRYITRRIQMETQKEKAPATELEPSQKSGDPASIVAYKDTDGNRMLRVAEGNGVEEQHWRMRTVSWGAFARQLETPIWMDVDYAGYWQLTDEDRKKRKNTRGFFGGELRGPNKTGANLVGRDLITLDLERSGGVLPVDIEDKVREAFPFEHVVYATANHRPESKRLRMVAPASRMMSPDEYRGIILFLATRVGMENTDKKSAVPTQFMYYPTRPIGAETGYEWHRGDWFDVDAFISSIPGFHDKSTWPGEEAAREREHKTSTHAHSAPGIIGAFNRRFDVGTAISKWLSDVYEEGANGRYTYTAGSSVNGLRMYHGELSAFDLVRLHKFGERDTEFADEIDLRGARMGDRPSFIAMKEWVVSEFPELLDDVAAHAEESRAKDEQSVAEDPSKWRSLLYLNAKGGVDPGPYNISTILRYDPMIRGKIWYNEMSYVPNINEGVPWPSAPGPMSDTDHPEMEAYLDRVYHIKNKSAMNSAILVAANRNRRHPLREKVLSVPWDGIPRIETCLRDFCGVADTPAHRLMSRRWFVGGIARIFRPGVKFDYCLVLVGDQGLGKSQFFTRVAMDEDLYLELDQPLDGTKTVPELVQGRWIVEFAEMSTVNSTFSSQEAVKAFITKTEDPYRAPFATVPLPHKRQCIFGGTSNVPTFLKDKTGARRFWPVEVSREAMGRMWDTLTPSVVQQLWAEAYVAYQAGEKVGLTREEEDLMEPTKGVFTVENENTSPLSDFLDAPLPSGWNKMTDVERRVAYIAWQDPSNIPSYVSDNDRWEVITSADLSLYYLCGGDEMKNRRLSADGKRAIRSVTDAMGDVTGLGKSWKYGPHRHRGTFVKGWRRIK